MIWRSSALSEYLREMGRKFDEAMDTADDPTCLPTYTRNGKTCTYDDLITQTPDDQTDKAADIRTLLDFAEGVGARPIRINLEDPKVIAKQTDGSRWEITTKQGEIRCLNKPIPQHGQQPDNPTTAL